jgi:hypothetical protein
LVVRADASVRLVYIRDAAAAAACRDEVALRRAVETRLGYDPFLPWGSATIVVRFDRDGEGFVARVEMVSAGESRGARTLRTDDSGCGGLVDAAALAVSIALDAAKPSGATDPPVATLGRPVPDPVPAPAASAEEVRPLVVSPPAEDARLRFRPVFGLDVLVSAWSAPGVSGGLAAWGRLEKGPWSLGVEARGDLPASGNNPVSTWLIAGGLAPCYHLGWAFGCVVGELGPLQGRGDNHPTPGWAVFAAVGPRVGVEIPVSPRASLRLRADFLANLDRVSVDLRGTQSPAWEAKAVTGTLGGGLAVHFP